MSKPLDERSPFWLGVVATAVVVALILLTIGFGELGLGQARYGAEFAQAGDLRPGDEVRVAGMPVGEVTGVDLAGDRVLVGFRADREVELGSETGASIKLATLLGGRYLELRPAGAGELVEDRIPLSRTSVPYDLQKVLQTGTPLLEELDPVLFRQALRTVADSLRGDGPKIGAALDGLSRMSGVITTRRDQIGRLIANADAVTTLLDEHSGKLFALLGQSDALLTELLRRRELVRAVITELATFTDQLRAALAENESRIGPLIDNTEEMTAVLRAQDDAVDRALELLAPAGRYLNNTLGNGPYLEIYLPYSLVPDNVLCRAGAVKGCK